MIKALLIISGSVSLGIGILGIFVPGLPTTSFLLLTAYLWARSSNRLYNKLLNNKYLGPYITEFRKNKGMTLQQKIYSIAMMWTMIGISTYFFIENRTVDYIVIAVGLTGTVVMGFIVKTVKKPLPEKTTEDI
ncbi:MAG: YbaN family protein [Bacteroidales bacterium]|nr:YbaN family protein [Bacteroidales bacterium]